ncbi:hypothetical protein [Nocardioides mesophilus]|uniref:Uncharacterized protein n=1 Tax=Nocardioides mesophilus TaxID=433659 RepID=A0A7G9RBN7_9ACTN|nr:hypothetical protein [Nocardioides mesophilus]QNN53012.1 hypothetical protein H9L09_00400 [Nocardioides mesophilus]
MTANERPRTPGRTPGPAAGPPDASAIDFVDEVGVLTGTGKHGRQWRITSVYTGWRLEFLDPGDERRTYAGTHPTLLAAKAEADR